MRVIQSKSEVEKFHKKLILQLEKLASEKIHALSGHKGVSYTKKVTYSEKLDIWWDMGDISRGKSGSRYWNAFGIGKPSPGKLTNIICEINYPVSGINQRVAANWVIEGSDVLLVHSGKIGGGRAGIGKNGFIENYTGVFEQTSIEDLPDQITVIGRLGDPGLPYQIRNFVFEVERIKDILVNRISKKSEKTPLEIIQHSFNEEFVGTKQYKNKKEKISSTVNHGLVVNTLKDLIASKGFSVANDQQRDLYIYNRNALIKTVFEIKTSLRSQTIFTAIGQLFVNNIRLKPVPKLVYVIPEKPNTNLSKTLKELNIEVLIYFWENGIPKFKNLDNII